jgi:uncharacterized protein with transglutaminase domain
VKRRHPGPLALLLILLGTGVFAYKVLVLRFPMLPGVMAPTWTVEARVTFRGNGQPMRASLFVPASDSRILVTDERFVAPGFKLSSAAAEDAEDTERRVTWSADGATSRQELTYRAVVRFNGKQIPFLDRPELTTPPLEQRSTEAARRVLASVGADASDTPQLVSELVAFVNRAPVDSDARLLLGNMPTAAQRAERVTTLLRVAGVPARLAHGIALRSIGSTDNRAAAAEIADWLEVHESQGWQAYSLRRGERLQITDEYLPWWYGTQPLLRVDGADSVRVTISQKPGLEAATSSAVTQLRHRQPVLLDFSPLVLPVQTQAVYRVLLLVPLGALIVVIVRNVVGLQTFGTFMPILLALAFRETRLLWGLALFSLIIAFGMAVRFYLVQLEILVLPRLASVLIVVVLLMLMVSVVAQKYGIEEGLAVGFFPMVILTMTVERMSTLWDELGGPAALSRLLGSLLVAVLIHRIIGTRNVEHLTFVFPELQLVVLAGCLLLGRYTGYRLVELMRFRAVPQDV